MDQRLSHRYVSRHRWAKQPHKRRCLPFEIASLSETKALSLIAATPSSTLTAYHHQQLTRVYPMGTRVGSSNLPVPCFLSCIHAGCQLICLNYQTNDAAQQLNRALFRLNGSCGYVLKEPVLTTPDSPYMPHQPPSAAAALARPGGAPLTLTFTILCAQHLPKPGEERIAPEIWDHFDPQNILPSQHRAPSLAAPSSVYCVVEAWQSVAGSHEDASLTYTTRHAPRKPFASHINLP